MKQQKGITLIALVITIIVLLILAGVTIAMLSGNNSAPQKATEAAQKDAIASAKDEIGMTVQEDLLNYYNNTYVVNTATSAATTTAGTKNTVITAADKAVKAVLNRNSELVKPSNTTTPADNTYVNTSTGVIYLKTKSFTSTGTISDTGSISWVNSWDQ